MKDDESNSRYRVLFDQVSDGIFIIDSNYKYVDVNKAGCLIYGYTKEELIGMDIFIMPQIENKEDLNIFIEKVKKGEFIVQEFKIKRKCGTYAYIEVSAKKLIDGNIQSVVRDISTRKEMQERLNATLEYDKLKTEFFSNLSHEFRTPLNVMLGVIQLQQTIYEDSFDSKYFEKTKKYMQILKQNCYRLMRVINNLLDITKIDAGYFPISLRNKNIVSVVEEITLSVVEYAESKGIELIFDTEIEEKIIAIDADKIERIIMNLLSNAIKFTSKGGCIRVNIYDKRDEIVISIKDNGMGIPKEKQKNIFDRYIQIDSSFARQHSGSGIGLALVKSLVELHNGSISLISEEGRGSEFIIEFPCIKVIEEQDITSLSYINQSKVERVSIEFSDIYK